MSFRVFIRESTLWQRRYSLEQWTRWIAEQAGSWLIIAAFCGSIRVSENSFSVCHRKPVSRSRAESRTGNVGRAASTKRLSSSFVPHSIAVSGQASSGVELGLPCRAVVDRVPRDEIQTKTSTERTRAIIVGEFVNHFVLAKNDQAVVDDRDSFAAPFWQSLRRPHHVLFRIDIFVGAIVRRNGIAHALLIQRPRSPRLLPTRPDATTAFENDSWQSQSAQPTLVITFPQFPSPGVKRRLRKPCSRHYLLIDRPLAGCC